MRKLGSAEPRDLNSPGVSGLLLEGCRVLTTAVFSTRDLGRISDLIVASTKETGLDEMRARALLLFSVFEACSNQLALADPGEPMQLELGYDSEKIAIGISFCSNQAKEELEKLPERLASGSVSGDFDGLIAELHRHSDRLLIRSVPGEKMEIVSLFAIDPSTAADSEEKPAPFVQFLDPESLNQSGPPATELMDLGDLDYAALLADGKVLAKSQGAPGEEPTITQSSEVPQNEKAVVQGSAEQGDSKTVVKGGASDADDSKTKFEGDAAAPGENLSLKAGATHQSGDSNDPRIAAYIQRINELAEQVKTLESSRAQATTDQALAALVAGVGPSQSATPLDAPAEEEGSGIQGLIQKIWPFNRKKKTEEELTQADVILPPTPEVTQEDPDQDELVSAITRGDLERALEKAQAELAQMKLAKDTPPKTQRWVEGMVSDLITEKARLSELAKQNNILVRRKELEYRRREAILTQALQKRNEEFRQKENALLQAKEQITTLNRRLEASSVTKKDIAEEDGLKQKYAESQRLLTQSKEDLSRLNKKLNEMKNQINSMNLSIKTKASGPSQSDFSALKANYEKMQRQADQFRDESVSLRDKVTELTEKLKEEQTRSGGPGDAKRLSAMLEQATKSYTAAKREGDAFKKAGAEKDKEISKLKMEVKQLRHALNQAKPASGKPGAGGKAA